ncbi:DUF6351 family protein [Propionibacteriaceae bacterium Y1685]
MTSPKPYKRLLRIGLVLALALAPAAFLPKTMPSAVAGTSLGVQVLSAPKAEMISGGDALIGVTLPTGADPESVTITAGRRDVSSAFAVSDGRLVGLVDKLPVGRTLVRAKLGARSAQVMVTNHPAQGPMFSGPHQQPFICQTQAFTSPVGGKLGDATDKNCSAPTKIEYGYHPKGSSTQLVKVADPDNVPDDVEMIKIADGRTVPYVVRIEYGVIDRSIYEYTVLHDPTEPVSATERPTGWNGRLLYNFGGGCTGGWYRQGTGTAGTTGDWYLRQGYAVASASLNVFGANCNAALGAEVMSMVRERVIEQIGVPDATIGIGCSGGSYQVFMIGDNYPGLLDGILAGCVFPEVAFGTLHMITDARLLNTWFTTSDEAAGWTEEQKRAASGFGRFGTIANLAASGSRIDPRLNCPSVLPVEDRYSKDNPDGARCDVYSHQINIWGDAGDGVPKRPLDNVGIQYGYGAYTDGTIDADQFLDLNEGIGGFDADATVVKERTRADADARAIAYRTGQLTNGGGGLAMLPIMELREYTDELPNGDIHLRFESFAFRDRLKKANGDADNHVMWTQNRGFGGFGLGNAQFKIALTELDEWVTSVKDKGAADHREVVNRKPSSLADACWSPDNQTKVSEQQVDGVDNTRCNTWYPSYPAPRQVAGGPVINDVITCQLTDPVREDYPTFTDQQWERLQGIFAGGVCDWDQPGVGQIDLGTRWPSFGR